MWSVLFAPSKQDLVPVLKDQKLKNLGGEESMYGRSVREASVYILSAAARQTGLVWLLLLLNNWLLGVIASESQ